MIAFLITIAIAGLVFYVAETFAIIERDLEGY